MISPASSPDRTWPPEAQRYPPVFPPAGASAWGDDPQGLWIDVDFGGVVQRFRWIEPGEFLMGSLEEETGRDSDEGPQHLVRLTEGFWLADTACAQGLWQALMGNNPSRFKDDEQNPVENVHWDDVQKFLKRVETQLPGIKAELPSEAEWEYACRAGSLTAYNFGKDINPEQANYGSHTVPVRRFKANAWGLYQMHGNVWEWCADGQRTYDALTQTNPRGPEGEEALRVVRGGSWGSGPHRLRSAYRSPGRRGRRYADLGFRFSLRSTRP